MKLNKIYLMQNLIKKYRNIKNLIDFNNLIRKYKIIKNFISFNKKLFIFENDNQKELVLVEYFNYYPSMISFSFFSHLLGKKYNSKHIKIRTAIS